MPAYQVTGPDGKKYRVNAPEGATQQQVLAYVQQQAGSIPTPTAAPPPKPEKPTLGFFPDMAAGAGQAVVNAGRSLQDIALDTANLSAAYDERQPTTLSPESIASARQKLEANVAEARQRDRPLLRSPGGITGNILGTVAMTAPAVAIPGVNTTAGAAAMGGTLGALQPTIEDESRTQNMAVGGLLGVAGQKAGQFIGNKVRGVMAGKQAAQQSNQVRDATLRAGQQAGYAVEPANVNASWMNRLLQGLSGKTATGQAAAMKNQGTTNRLAREALGLPDNAPLTSNTLSTLRREAGTAYKDLGTSLGTFVPDEQYADDVARLLSTSDEIASEFKSVATGVSDALKRDLTKQAYKGGPTIEFVKQLRRDASTLFRSDEPEKIAAARIKRGAADVIEDLMERTLEQTGDAAKLQAFRAARETIAKTHTIEAALNQGTGNVIASRLAAQLKQGKPLSGGLETIGRFQQAFPRSTQEVANSGWLSMPGPSPLDWLAAGGASVATGNPAAMGLLAARPAARSALLSAPYQSLMTKPNYAPSLLQKSLISRPFEMSAQSAPLGLLGVSQGRQ